MDEKLNWVNEAMWEDYNKQVDMKSGSKEFHRTMFGRMLKAVESRNTEFLYGDMLVLNPEYLGDLDFEDAGRIVRFVKRYHLKELVQSYIDKVRVKEVQKREEILKLLEPHCQDKCKRNAIAAIAMQHDKNTFGIVSPIISEKQVREIYQKSGLLEYLENN